MSKIVAHIKNNETGEVRAYAYETEDQYGEQQPGWWRDGNGSCDCNREIHSRWAAKEPEPDDEYDEMCGHTRYSVEYITVNGVRHEIDGHPDSLAAHFARTAAGEQKMKEVKVGDVVEFIFGQPGNDATYILVESIDGDTIKGYDLCFEMPIDIALSRAWKIDPEKEAEIRWGSMNHGSTNAKIEADKRRAGEVKQP